MKRTIKIIHKYFLNSLQMQLNNITGLLVFFISKITRYALFIIFLFFLSNRISTVGSYSSQQMIMFYLVFILIDTSAQMLFRETYRFRPLIISGGFDMVLSKPFNPLVRVLFGGPDFIDMGVLLIIVALLIYNASFLNPSAINILAFIALVINSLIIATGFHIMVLSVGILTLSVDHLIMVYRDLTTLARIPVDFITGSLRPILTFVIPLGIMFTYPAKSLFGLLSWQLVTISFFIGILFLWLSLKFWSYSLKRYQSASS